MPIPVTCPGCLKRFQVHEKFAGKTGPCPNCSKPITIPAQSQQVVIHAPADIGPKDSKGRPVFKPLQRQEVKVSLPVALTAAGASVVALVVALAVRLTATEPPTAILALGTILLAPPLALLGYWFLRDDELEGFQGQELVARVALVSVVFMVTWGIYAAVPRYVGSYTSMAQFDIVSVGIVVPIMLTIGTAASILTLELESIQGFLHYLLYFALTLILALIMGTPIAEPFARPALATPTGISAPASPPPAATSPGTPANSSQAPARPNPPAQPPPPANPNAQKKPRLMQ